MKNEDRMAETLAELLRKQDQHDEKLTRIINIQEKQGETLDKHTELFTLFISEIKGLRSDFNRMTDFYKPNKINWKSESSDWKIRFSVLSKYFT